MGADSMRRMWVAGLALAFLLMGIGCGALLRGPVAGASGPLLASMQVYTAGEAATMILQVTNVSEAEVELHFPTGQTYDFVVTQSGRELWRWSDDQMFTQALRRQAIAPGETLRFEAVWPAAGASAGDYVATGILTADEHRVEQSTAFSLE